MAHAMAHDLESAVAAWLLLLLLLPLPLPLLLPLPLPLLLLLLLLLLLVVWGVGALFPLWGGCGFWGLGFSLSL